MPRVSIVAVTWNRRDCIETLLASLAELNYPNFEVVVVDNASTDGTAEMLTQDHPSVVLIANEDNLGGSGGFNCGMRHVLAEAKSAYIWLLDNDAEVFPDTLIELIRVLESDPSIGLAGSAIINPEAPEKYVELGVNINWKRGFVEPLYENRLVADIPEGVYEVDFVPACSALVRSGLLDPGRLMDERYFLWWDDADFCCSLRERGARTVCVSRSIVRHPTEKSRPIINYYNLRNALLFFAKHSPARHLPGIYASLAGSTAKVIAYNRLNGKGMLGHYVQCAVMDYLDGKWGKFDHQVPTDCTAGRAAEGKHERIVLMPSSNLENIVRCLAHLKQREPSARIDLLIQSYRKSLFEGKGFDGIIPYDDRTRFSLFRRGWQFLQLVAGKYGLAVNADLDFVSPFSYAANEFASYDPASGQVFITGTRRDCWRLLVTILAGWLMGALLFIAIAARGVRYRLEK